MIHETLFPNCSLLLYRPSEKEHEKQTKKKKTFQLSSHFLGDAAVEQKLVLHFIYIYKGLLDDEEEAALQFSFKLRVMIGIHMPYY